MTPITRILAMVLLAGCAAAPDRLTAQPVSNPMTVQNVDSRRGFVMRIPVEAKLDSAHSGWSQKGLYERRVYRIEGAGEIRTTVTVKVLPIPDSAKRSGPYQFVNADSATPNGTAYSRTYFMPTRNVRIEFIPYGQKMQKYSEARNTIFASFRWKPKANTEVIDVDPAPSAIPAQTPPAVPREEPSGQQLTPPVPTPVHPQRFGLPN